MALQVKRHTVPVQRKTLTCLCALSSLLLAAVLVPSPLVPYISTRKYRNSAHLAQEHCRIGDRYGLTYSFEHLLISRVFVVFAFTWHLHPAIAVLLCKPEVLYSFLYLSTTCQDIQNREVLQ